MPNWSARRALALGIGLAAFSPARAAAIPLFAHQYGVSCEKCHSVIPHLNPFGAAFLANGERFPGVSAGPAFPFAAKTNLVASTQNQGAGPEGQGLPKAIVDEIELFAAGTIGTRAAFFAEQYLVDGGEPGMLHDAWVGERANPWTARIPLQVQAGLFELPQPVDPETFRDTYEDYAPLVQTVGTNPFDFKTPKAGVRLGIGDGQRGWSLQAFAGPGHDLDSGLPSTGIDTEVSLQDAFGPFSLSALRYDGVRPTATGNDRFSRTLYGFTFGQWTRFSSEAVWVHGWDSDCAAPPLTGCVSSGGFEQLRYMLSRRLFAEARYEGTYDPANGVQHDAVGLFGYGPSENTRVTIEDVVRHGAGPVNTLNLQFTAAY